ncbi:MAG: glycosyltransferase [Chloroflexota bacterium]|nr:MAG: glycosyltransferase [Chloroflexota bacterium]
MDRATIRRLAYVANIRFPTEKAHGLQIARMCEAFADAGVATTLVHPRRRQTEPGLPSDGRDYYGVRHVFEVAPTRNIDVVRWSYLPRPLFVPLFFLHNVIWGLYAAIAIRRSGFDACFTRDIAAAFWLALLGFPVAYEAHSVPRGAQRLVLAALVRLPALRLLVALTKPLRERLIALGARADRCIVQADAADLAAFDAAPDRSTARGTLGLPLDQTIVGYLGRFQTLGMEKGLHELIQAVGHLSQPRPLLLCVGGPMDAVAAYRARARQCGFDDGDARFVDRVPSAEVPLWLRAFDIAVAPFPDTEHYAYFMSPLKIFEYLASGLPIVATDLPSLREVLVSGENALLMPAGDTEALAAALRDLIGDPDARGRLGRAARATAEGHTWSARARAILRAFDSVA